MIKKQILSFIRFYQVTLSPDHGWLRFRHPSGRCRFYPSCSEYAYQAIERKGVLRGALMSGWRLLRCNPWSRGGFDYVKR